MKRLRRRVFDFAAALSLLLGLVMIGLMVRGFWRVDSLAKYWWDPKPRSLARAEFVFSGNLHIRCRTNPGQTARPAVVDQLVGRLRTAGEMEWRFFHLETSPSQLYELLLGFGYNNSSGTLPSGSPWSILEIEIPYWPLILLSGVLPFVWIVSRRRRRDRLRDGRCRDCGYDLRATPDRCPECGAVPSLAAGRKREMDVGSSQ